MLLDDWLLLFWSFWELLLNKFDPWLLFVDPLSKIKIINTFVCKYICITIIAGLITIVIEHIVLVTGVIEDIFV